MLLGDVIPQMDGWLQYGCFGLLAVLIVLVAWKGFPKALEIYERSLANMAAEHKAEIAHIVATHERVVSNLTAAYERDAAECRAERMALMKMLADSQSLKIQPPTKEPR